MDEINPLWSKAGRKEVVMKSAHQILCEIWQAVAIKNDQLFRKGLDFSRWMSPSEAGFSEKQGNQYQPCTDTLVKVLKRFPIGQEDCILDMGCGKGKAMYLMSQFPFRKIRGYDLSAELVRIANENFKTLHLEQCHSVQADAMQFRDYDEFNYFYIYNAFPQEVFEVMIENLMDSIKRKPRSCRFIYLNPVCHDYLVSHTPFRLIYKRKSWIGWFDYYCYENVV